jgi:hypothetical protein
MFDFLTVFDLKCGESSRLIRLEPTIVNRILSVRSDLAGHLLLERRQPGQIGGHLSRHPRGHLVLKRRGSFVSEAVRSAIRVSKERWTGGSVEPGD